MSQPKSNCYGFVYAGLNNSQEEFLKDREDLHFKPVELYQKINSHIEEVAQDIADTFCFSEDKLKVLELLDGKKISHHVAFIDANGKYYDQDGVDGEVRLGGELEDLIRQYTEDSDIGYYKVYPLNKDAQENAETFLKELDVDRE